MKKGHTEIVCIIDRSGSMQSIKDDAIGGFNSFLEDQRKVPGTATVTLVLFDHEYIVVHDGVDLSTVKDLNGDTFVPRGNTALLDAVGRAINEVGARLSNMPEDQRPEKVMVCILTDGYENCSQEFSAPKIREMINHQRDKYSWEFSFLAANADAFTTASNMGIKKDYTSSFEKTSDGVRNAFYSMHCATAQYRQK